jgi:hypothetical protein
LVQVSLTEQSKVLAKNALFPLQGTLAEAIGKLPETGLEFLECIVGLIQMQHVDAAPILEAGPIDLVLRDTGA